MPPPALDFDVMMKEAESGDAGADLLPALQGEPENDASLDRQDICFGYSFVFLFWLLLCFIWSKAVVHVP